MKIQELRIENIVVGTGAAGLQAALSTRSFFRLVELGAPFPCTEHGEFMG